LLPFATLVTSIGLAVCDTVDAWDACGAGACPAVLFTDEAAGDGACVLAVVVTDLDDLVVFLAGMMWAVSLWIS
jgi:hypothetical protein